MNQEQIQALARLVAEAKRIVFFGGAGVSTESGIPDFRSATGLYSGQQSVSPEALLHHSYFMADPEGFYDFYRGHMLFPDAPPNAAHKTLAKWEQQGRLSAVITQNIDGLHQAAGSQTVHELHGSVHRNHCLSCGKPQGLDSILHSSGAPRCNCGGLIKPDVVLYGEGLDDQVVSQAIQAIAASDLLIIGGTSLRVYPAAGFVRGYRGKLVIINMSGTDMDGEAELLISAPIGQALQAADALLS